MKEIKTMLIYPKAYLNKVVGGGFTSLRKNCMIVASVALIVSGASAMATTLVDDTFAGVTTATLNANGWYFLNSSSGGTPWQVWNYTSAPFVAETLANPGGSSGWTYGLRQYSSTTLTNVGDTLSLQLNYRVGNAGSGQLFLSMFNTAATITSNAFGYTTGTGGTDPIGDAAGYMVQTVTSTSGTVGALRQITNDADSLLAATSGTATLGDTSAHTLLMTLTRVSTGTQIEWSVDGTSLGSTIDTTAPYYTFNSLDILDGGNTPVYLDNILITSTPEPSAMALISICGGVFVLWRMGSIRRRCSVLN